MPSRSTVYLKITTATTGIDSGLTTILAPGTEYQDEILSTVLSAPLIQLNFEPADLSLAVTNTAPTAAKPSAPVPSAASYNRSNSLLTLTTAAVIGAIALAALVIFAAWVYRRRRRQRRAQVQAELDGAAIERELDGADAPRELDGGASRRATGFGGNLLEVEGAERREIHTEPHAFELAGPSPNHSKPCAGGHNLAKDGQDRSPTSTEQPPANVRGGRAGTASSRRQMHAGRIKNTEGHHPVLFPTLDQKFHVPFKNLGDELAPSQAPIGPQQCAMPGMSRQKKATTISIQN